MIRSSKTPKCHRQASRRVPLAAVGVSLTVVLALGGCAVGPDFKPPAAPADERYTPEHLASPGSGGREKGSGQRFAEGADVPARWWNAFKSPALNDIVERSLGRNPSLEAALAAIEVARANTDAQRGQFFPQVGANATSSRQLISNNTTLDPTDPNATPQSPYSLHTPQVNVAFVPDIWGANVRQAETLEAQAEQQKYQYLAASLALTSNVVNAAIGEASSRAQIAATRRIIAIETELLDLLRRQRALGQIAEADVQLQVVALAQSQQLLPPLEKQLAQQRDLMIALTGERTSIEMTETFELHSLRLPRTLPVSLPATMLAQRPDVRAAEAMIHQASADLGVAIANRLPNIVLTANAGSSAFRAAELFTPGTGFYTLAASATQPIFTGGTLAAKQKAAEATLKQAQASYRNAVVTAFQNVTDALRALQQDARAVNSAVAAESAASRLLDIVRGQLQAGQVNQFALLNAQQSYLQATLSRIQAESNRLADSVALFTALGGGLDAADL